MLEQIDCSVKNDSFYSSFFRFVFSFLWTIQVVRPSFVFSDWHHRLPKMFFVFKSVVYWQKRCPSLMISLMMQIFDILNVDCCICQILKLKQLKSTKTLLEFLVLTSLMYYVHILLNYVQLQYCTYCRGWSGGCRVQWYRTSRRSTRSHRIEAQNIYF